MEDFPIQNYFCCWIIKIFTRSVILQGQALFIRIEQKILFHFLSTDRKRDRKDGQTKKVDRQKDYRQNKHRQTDN